MRNAWGSSEDDPTTSLKMVARIRKPILPAAPNSTKFAKQIRNDILRDLFSFTDADVEDFNKQHPTDLVIEDTLNKNKWATDIQVKSWKAGTDGLVPITLGDLWVTAVWDFLKQRASFEAFKVGMFIDNAEIRKNITDDFENILSSFGEKRIFALSNLMNTIAGSPFSRAGIYKALRYLSNESGYRNNPFLMIAIAATTAYKSDTPSFGSDDVNQSTITNAVKAANDNLYNNPAKSALAKISPLEASKINEWASQLYDNSHANNEATNRRWVARMLGMTDAERRSLIRGRLFFNRTT